MNFFIFLKNFLNAFFDLILPHRCIACGETVNRGGLVCKLCFENLDFISEPFCAVCGVPFDYTDNNQMICMDCIKNKPYFDKAKAVFLYEGSGQNMIKAFKYADRTEAVEYFSQLMINAGQKILNDKKNPIDYIIPVPIHRKKLIIRKFNQSALLVRKIAKKTGLKANYDVLIRKKNTKPQSKFYKKDRFKNVRGVFDMKKTDFMKNKNILLIDDVLTTGATVSECAKVMKKNGVKNVYVLALARTKV